MADRLAIAHRIMQARNKGVPSLIANFGGLMTASAETLTPLLLVTTGDVLRYEAGQDADITAWTTWAARPLIVEVVANRWVQMSGIRVNEKILARAYGEMMGLSTVKHQDTLEMRNHARIRLEEILLNNPPSASDLRSLVTEIVRKTINASPALLPLNETRNVLPGDGQVSDQTFRFYQLRGHMLPVNLFLNQNARDAWRVLSNPLQGWMQLENIDFSLVENINVVWTTMDVTSALGYYEGKAQQNLTKCRGMVAGAVFTYIATFAKNINDTCMGTAP